MVAQVLHVRKEPDACPQPQMRTTLSKHVTWFWDRWVNTNELSNCLQISYGSASEIIHNKLGFHKACARWVPKQLTMLHKQICLGICQQHLDRLILYIVPTRPFWLLLVWFTQKGIKGPSIHLRLRCKGSGARMAHWLADVFFLRA
jgi:hypothetical protein